MRDLGAFLAVLGPAPATRVQRGAHKISSVTVDGIWVWIFADECAQMTCKDVSGRYPAVLALDLFEMPARNSITNERYDQ